MRLLILTPRYIVDFKGIDARIENERAQTYQYRGYDFTYEDLGEVTFGGEPMYATIATAKSLEFHDDWD